MGAGGAKENLRLRELLLPIRRIGGIKRRRRRSSRGERGLDDLGAAASGRMEAMLRTSAALAPPLLLFGGGGVSVCQEASAGF